jgi:hypothetical protein
MGSYSLSQAPSSAIDARIAIEGGTAGGQVVSPEATVGQASGVAIRTGEFSQLNQSWDNVSLGMSGEDVRQLLLAQNAEAQQAQQAVSQIGTAAVNALSEAKTGYTATTDYTKYIPYAVVTVIVLAMIRAGGHRK